MMLVLTFFVPAIMVMLLDSKTANVGTFIFIGGLSIFNTYTYWKRLRKLRTEIRNHRLGYDGERYVAAELNGLMRVGWRVYHDFIVDDKPGGEGTNFNIDHVAVCERGVFVFDL